MNHDSLKADTKKKRIRRSAEKMAELVLEAERVGQAQVCRRENIAPAQLSRWKQKFLQGGIASLKAIRRGPKPKVDPAIQQLKLETERLSHALLETSIELQASTDPPQGLLPLDSGPDACKPRRWWWPKQSDAT